MIGMIGFGGHAKVITDIFMQLYPQETIQYFSKEIQTNHSANVIEENEQNLQKYLNIINKWHVAIGDPMRRKEKVEWLLKHKVNVISAIHEKTIIAKNTKIGTGTAIIAGSIINPDVELGKGCIINTGSTIDHDCKIADYVNISPGCHLAGGVKVGTLTTLGTGAIVIPNVSIGSHSYIGAGAVVTKNIPDHCVAVGVPAKIISQQ